MGKRKFSVVLAVDGSTSLDEFIRWCMRYELDQSFVSPETCLEEYAEETGYYNDEVIHMEVSSRNRSALIAALCDFCGMTVKEVETRHTF